MTTNKKVIWSMVICLVVFGIYSFSSTNKQKENTKIEEKQISKNDIIKKELTDKYQAITNLSKGLIYTIQAQDRLISDKPSLFIGNINDILKRDKKTFIRFSSLVFNWDKTFDMANYELELECDKQIINKITTYNKDTEYALVAKISEITRPVFALKGSSYSLEDVEINIESSDLFLAKGTCIDIVELKPEKAVKNDPDENILDN